MNDNITALLIALFSGAAASLVAGYFSRPKTRSEAKQADANASVSLSADAREWAQLWMKKAEAAERKADEAERRTDEAEVRIDNLESTLTAFILYTKKLQQEINKLGGHVPLPPPNLQKYT